MIKKILFSILALNMTFGLSRADAMMVGMMSTSALLGAGFATMHAIQREKADQVRGPLTARMKVPGIKGASLICNRVKYTSHAKMTLVVPGKGPVPPLIKKFHRSGCTPGHMNAMIPRAHHSFRKHTMIAAAFAAPAAVATASLSSPEEKEFGPEDVPAFNGAGN